MNPHSSRVSLVGVLHSHKRPERLRESEILTWIRYRDLDDEIWGKSALGSCLA